MGPYLRSEDGKVEKLKPPANQLSIEKPLKDLP